MTGPAHFARAEEHLALAASTETDGHDDSMSAWHQRQAHVHATLAAAAATAEAFTPFDRKHQIWLEVSWPDMMTPWAPAPADPLRTVILGGLACAALTCHEAGDDDLAAAFTDACTQVANGSAAWCDLAVKLISEMN